MDNINIGLGFRRELTEAFLTGEVNPDFIEVAPENWIDIGGYWEHVFNKITDEKPLILHGLSLSIGSPEDIDLNFLKKIKKMIEDYNVNIYSEHLSFAKFNNAHLYDLLPLPFRYDAVKHIVDRINRVQDFLKMQITLENVSYYTTVEPEMTESEFINEIVKHSGCGLLLDVNNVYVNSVNHGYNMHEFINSMPLDSVRYIHMAGHKKISEDFIIDTHGEPVIGEVFDLFDYTLNKMKTNVPVLLERDFNFPEINELNEELASLRKIAKKHVAHELFI